MNEVKQTSIVFSQIQANAIEIMKMKGRNPEHEEFYTELKAQMLKLKEIIKEVI